LDGIDASSLFVVLAETVPAGSTLACLSLVFGHENTCGQDHVLPLLEEVGHHAAALMLDAYLGLPGARGDGVRLSAREGECLHWAAAGKTSWETACILGVRERTVNFHLGNAFAKLKVNNKQAAVAQAIKQGLLAV
jgi:DNA-binding CsgD family transcriptional regulator